MERMSFLERHFVQWESIDDRKEKIISSKEKGKGKSVMVSFSDFCESLRLKKGAMSTLEERRQKFKSKILDMVKEV